MIEEMMNIKLKELREEIKSGQEEIKSIADMKVDSLEMTACHEKMEACTEKIEPDPRMIQSVAEHQEVPKGEAAVMPVRGPRKRRTDQNLAAERQQNLKEGTQASFESRKRLTMPAGG
jgi:hypothetical protein